MVEPPVGDILGLGLKILFCGINPGLLSAATHHHFAHPGNRFWKILYLSELTPRLLKPSEQAELLNFGLGITNLVARGSATARELSSDEYKEGAHILEQKVLQFQPDYLAILGIEAYKKGFGFKSAQVGLQKHLIGKTPIWLLPNPSGLNAHYSLADFVTLFSALNQAVKRS